MNIDRLRQLSGVRESNDDWIQRAVEDIKQFIAQYNFSTAEEAARSYFSSKKGPGTHGNFDILSPDVQEFYINIMDLALKRKY